MVYYQLSDKYELNTHQTLVQLKVSGVMVAAWQKPISIM